MNHDEQIPRRDTHKAFSQNINDTILSRKATLHQGEKWSRIYSRWTVQNAFYSYLIGHDEYKVLCKL